MSPGLCAQRSGNGVSQTGGYTVKPHSPAFIQLRRDQHFGQICHRVLETVTNSWPHFQPTGSTNCLARVGWNCVATAVFSDGCGGHHQTWTFALVVMRAMASGGPPLGPTGSVEPSLGGVPCSSTADAR